MICSSTRYVIVVDFFFLGLIQRIKRVVQHATRLNEAISAVRGVPVTRAQITVGGYYDAL